MLLEVKAGSMEVNNMMTENTNNNFLPTLQTKKEYTSDPKSAVETNPVEFVHQAKLLVTNKDQRDNPSDKQ